MRACDVGNLEQRFKGISVRQITPAFRLSQLTVFSPKEHVPYFWRSGKPELLLQAR